MKRITILFLFALVVSSCNNKKGQKTSSANIKTELTGSIKIDGSGTVLPVSEAVSEEFHKIEPKVKVTVGESGTGGGFKKFTAGLIDISDASRDIKQSEIDLAKKNGINYIRLTVALDGISICVSKENTWAKSITTKELKSLWQPNSNIKKWSDIRKNWPDKKIHLYGPNTSHGTYDFFTEAIMGKSGASRTDYNAVSDYNVAVQGIENDKYALGYFGLSYYEENKDKLNLLGVDNGSGAVLPSVSTVASNEYAPLSRSLYIFVNSKSLKRPAVSKYVKFYLDSAPELSKEVGYVPMTKKGCDEQKAILKKAL